jgi:hypothetical protein
MPNKSTQTKQLTGAVGNNSNSSDEDSDVIFNKTLTGVRSLFFHPIVSGIPATTKMLGTSAFKIVDKTSDYDALATDISTLSTDITPEYSTAFAYESAFQSNSSTMTPGGWQVAGFLRVKHGDRHKITLRGVVKRVGGGDIGGAGTSTHILTLAAGYRPPGAASFMVVAHCSSSPFRHWALVDINGSNGNVIAYSTRGFKQVNLDGVEFFSN